MFLIGQQQPYPEFLDFTLTIRKEIAIDLGNRIWQTNKFQLRSHSPYDEGNISGANQLLRVNYGNFNLDHQINIQGEGRREVGGAICKSVITQSKGGSRL